MKYMMLIYSREDSDATPEQRIEVASRHGLLMSEAAQRGVLVAADPLESSGTATTVRTQRDQVMVTDGPYAETKEQLAGYYLMDCENLDEAIAWAARIPTACQGGEGCVEIRPLRDLGPLGVLKSPPADG